MNTKDGCVIDVRTCTAPTEKQHTIYNKLQIKHTPLGRKNIKSPMKTQRCSAENEGLKSYHIGNKRDTISACRSWVKEIG
ncbi:MAG: hypothetical protein HS127_07015 [Planctomycetia bacterium]|nr:hypothetical protein [Planctomycetia bacterium]